VNQEKTVFICEDSAEGIFTAVYDGWLEAKKGQIQIRICEPENMELFTRFQYVKSDSEKAGRVMRTVLMKLGTIAYQDLWYAAAASDPDRGTAVFYTVYKSYNHGKWDPGIMEAVADAHVGMVSRLRTRVWRELHHYYGFLRFREIGGQVLFSEIEPESDILEMLGEHFKDRFQGENWMIYDKRRKKAILHPRQSSCTVIRDVQPKMTDQSLGQPEIYEDLWRAFCGAIAIPERKNLALQQQLLPLKYRRNMVEFT